MAVESVESEQGPMMKRLALPADLSSKAVGMLTVSEIELVSKLGLPHFRSEGGPEYPGPVQVWGIEAESGIRVILEYHSSNGVPSSIVTHRMSIGRSKGWVCPTIRSHGGTQKY